MTRGNKDGCNNCENGVEAMCTGGIEASCNHEESDYNVSTPATAEVVKRAVHDVSDNSGTFSQLSNIIDKSLGTEENLSNHVDNIEAQEDMKRPIIQATDGDHNIPPACNREVGSEAAEVVTECMIHTDDAKAGVTLDAETHDKDNMDNNNKNNTDNDNWTNVTGNIVDESADTVNTNINDDVNVYPEEYDHSWLPSLTTNGESNVGESPKEFIELNVNGDIGFSSNGTNDYHGNEKSCEDIIHIHDAEEDTSNRKNDADTCVDINTDLTADNVDTIRDIKEYENDIKIDYTLWKFINCTDNGDDDIEDKMNVGMNVEEGGIDNNYHTKTIDGDKSEVKTTAEAVDPWKMPEVTIEVTPWNELSRCQKVRRVTWDYIGKCLLLLVCLYFFVCSLDLLSSSFRLLGGKTAGSVFKNSALLGNPVACLTMGVLATVLLQSSSTTIGIAISMVVADVMDVRGVIPIVMGANIGTSVTNTLLSLGQMTNRDDFRRAFAGATVHDMFNWLSVLVLLPLEVATGYLYWLTKAIVSTMSFPTHGGKRKRQQFLKTITKPFTNLIIKIDKRVLEDIATGRPDAADRSIIRHCCRTGLAWTRAGNVTGLRNASYSAPDKTCVQPCNFMFESVSNHWSDSTVGLILLLLTLVILTACFITLVRTIYSMLRGQILIVLKKIINSDFPGRWSFLTGYLAIIVGTGTTMIVQSSSVVTSSLTPLVGMGLVSIERMYPLTLGANLGTTFTAIIIALSQSADDMPVAFHVALCHMFFNISGVVIFYPIPRMRIPIRMAKFLGNETAKYRWFGIAYMIAIFIVFPAVIFTLSAISWIALVTVAVPVVCLTAAVITVNIIQNKIPELLPQLLRTWEFLPPCFRSLEPYDRLMARLIVVCRCCRCKREEKENSNAVDKI